MRTKRSFVHDPPEGNRPAHTAGKRRVQADLGERLPEHDLVVSFCPEIPDTDFFNIAILAVGFAPPRERGHSLRVGDHDALIAAVECRFQQRADHRFEPPRVCQRLIDVT